MVTALAAVRDNAREAGDSLEPWPAPVFNYTELIYSVLCHLCDRYTLCTPVFRREITHTHTHTHTHPSNRLGEMRDGCSGAPGESTRE